jgi:hypothetical protein
MRPLPRRELIIECVAVISDLPGESRFASVATRRLAKLGAITQGDQPC